MITCPRCNKPLKSSTALSGGRVTHTVERCDTCETVREQRVSRDGNVTRSTRTYTEERAERERE